MDPADPTSTDAAPSSELRQRWTPTGTGERYDRQRWSHRGRRDRDPELVRTLLGRLELRADARILDVPCGTGRLRAALESSASYVGLDVSPAMLAAAGASVAAAPHGRRLLRADVEHLPFRDDTFEVVVCCRLLHHLKEPELLESALAELVRVSSSWILGSFWDAGSLESLRRRLPLARQPRNRIARRRRELALALGQAGASVQSWHSSLPGLSQQVWFLARTSGDSAPR